MSEARRPSLPWISCVVKPSLSVGTRKQARPRCFFSGSVWAKISATSAKFAIEIHIFWPLIDQPESVFVARVRRLAASEPVSGSVRPKQPSASPEHSRGSQLPLLLLAAPALDRAGDQRGLDRDHGAGRGVGAADLLDDQPVADVVEAAAAVALRRPSRRGSRPRPACAPARGRSARRGRSPATRGRISRSANSRADSAISFCSSLRLKSTPCPSLGSASRSKLFQLPLQRRGEGLLRLASARSGGGRQRGAVDRRRRPGSRAWSRRGRPRWRRAGRRVPKLPCSTCSARIRRSRVIDSSTPSASDGVRSSPSGETQKIEEVGGSSTVPSGRTSTASSAPRCLAIRVACMLAA